MGLPALSAPESRARVKRGNASAPSTLPGGTYVRTSGTRLNGYEQLTTLDGATVWVAVNPGAGPSLCTVETRKMDVCGGERSDRVAVHKDFRNTDRPPASSLSPGTSVRTWGYYEDHGRLTFVEYTDGSGFVDSRHLCPDSRPPTPTATAHFNMSPADAGPSCYAPHRERDAGDIRRIVIHNSENTLKSTIATFRSCHPDRPTSAHVAIDRDGRYYRLVEDKFVAFHTGGANGGFNAVSLGIEVIASEKPGWMSMTRVQERSLVELIRFWMDQYSITLSNRILLNSTSAAAYNDLEYREAPVTAHRLISAGRGTDCPKFLWDDTVAGDEHFLRWRERHFKDRMSK